MLFQHHSKVKVLYFFSLLGTTGKEEKGNQRNLPSAWKDLNGKNKQSLMNGQVNWHSRFSASMNSSYPLRCIFWFRIFLSDAFVICSISFLLSTLMFFHRGRRILFCSFVFDVDPKFRLIQLYLMHAKWRYDFKIQNVLISSLWCPFYSQKCFSHTSQVFFVLNLVAGNSANLLKLRCIFI